MDQSESSISNSFPLSHDNAKMTRNGGIFKSFRLKSLISKQFSCSYVLTVLLFKYTAGCANTCPGNGSCDKTPSRHHRQEDNHQPVISVHLTSHLLPVKLTAISSSSFHQPSKHHHKPSAYTLSNLPFPQSDLPVALLPPPCRRNFSTCASGHGSSIQSKPAVKKSITMADGPFSPGDPNSYSRPGEWLEEILGLYKSPSTGGSLNHINSAYSQPFIYYPFLFWLSDLDDSTRYTIPFVKVSNFHSK